MVSGNAALYYIPEINNEQRMNEAIMMTKKKKRAEQHWASSGLLFRTGWEKREKESTSFKHTH